MNAYGKHAISIEEFSEQFSIGKTKIYSEIKRGRLKAKKLGRRTLITLEAAHNWIDMLPEIGDQSCK